MTLKEKLIRAAMALQFMTSEKGGVDKTDVVNLKRVTRILDQRYGIEVTFEPDFDVDLDA